MIPLDKKHRFRDTKPLKVLWTLIFLVAFMDWPWQRWTENESPNSVSLGSLRAPTIFATIFWHSSASSKMLRACCHSPAFSQALMAELHVMVSGLRPVSPTRFSNPNACCHSAALPHALMAALYVTRSDWKSLPSTSSSKIKATSHWAALSQTLMLALKVITLGVKRYLSASANRDKACCQCWPFLHLTMAFVQSTIDALELPSEPIAERHIRKFLVKMSRETFL